MPRKRPQGEAPAATTPPSETPPEATTTSPTEPGPNGDGNKPAFRVGPISTSKDNAVCAAVWGNEVTISGEPVTVYNITAEARYCVNGEWKSGRQFRGSQVYALVYCLNRCSDWILAQRDPQQACPF